MVTVTQLDKTYPVFDNQPKTSPKTSIQAPHVPHIPAIPIRPSNVCHSTLKCFPMRASSVLK